MTSPRPAHRPYPAWTTLDEYKEWFYNETYEEEKERVKGLGPCRFFIWTPLGNYNNVKFFDGYFYTGHRIAWFLEYGEWSTREFPLDHLCNNVSCVQLAHLERVTRGENVRRGQAVSPIFIDMRRKAEEKQRLIVEERKRKQEEQEERRLYRLTCVNGHPWITENLQQYGRHTQCKLCHRERQLAYLKRTGRKR